MKQDLLGNRISFIIFTLAALSLSFKRRVARSSTSFKSAVCWILEETPRTQITVVESNIQYMKYSECKTHYIIVCITGYLIPNLMWLTCFKMLLMKIVVLVLFTFHITGPTYKEKKAFRSESMDTNLSEHLVEVLTKPQVQLAFELVLHLHCGTERWRSPPQHHQGNPEPKTARAPDKIYPMRWNKHC